MMSSNDEYTNRYSFFEILTLGISVIFTKLFYKKAKLISYPIYMRGKKNFVYGENLSIGYGCRFDLIKLNTKTLFIDENANIGDYCHFVAANKVVIGKNFLCGSKVFISDTNHGIYNGEDCSIPMEKPCERKYVTNPVWIGNNVWIGDNVVVLPGSQIGNGCIVGANTVVTKQFEDNCIIVGNPARVIKRYDESLKRWEKI